MVAAEDKQDFDITLYAVAANGAGSPVNTLPGGLSVDTRIISGDLGNGLEDLVAASETGDSVSIYLQNPDGTFQDPEQVNVGISPSDIALDNMGGSYGPNLLVTDQSSGQVSVLVNLFQNFLSEQFYPSATGVPGDLSNVDIVNSTKPVWTGTSPTLPVTNAALASHSFRSPSNVIVWPDQNGQGNDAIVVNSGLDSFSVLQPDSQGGFINAQAGQSFPTGQQPAGAVLIPAFGNQPAELAVLNRGDGTISIFRSDGHGSFVAWQTGLSAGDAAHRPVRRRCVQPQRRSPRRRAGPAGRQQLRRSAGIARTRRRDL